MAVESLAGPTIVLLSPGLREEQIVWGERIATRSEKRCLEREWPGAQVFTFDLDDLDTIRAMDVDLLISYYTGPAPPWRVDDIADYVDGVTILKVVNHADLLDDFCRVPVDGFITNSRLAAARLAAHRPTRYLSLAVDDDFGPVIPDPRYRADVVYLGSGGRGNKRPQTTRHYLDPAKAFDFHLWGGSWDAAYWEPMCRDRPETNDWHRYCRG